jgi:hypothetical protein
LEKEKVQGGKGKIGRRRGDGMQKRQGVSVGVRVWPGWALGPDGGMPTGPLGLVGWGGCFPLFFYKQFSFIYFSCLFTKPFQIVFIK